MFMFRVLKVFVLSAVNTFIGVITFLLPLLIVLTLAGITGLELTTLGLHLEEAAMNGADALGFSDYVPFWAVLAVIWLGCGALFLRYQLHLDRVRLRAARQADTTVSASMQSLPDVLFHTGFTLLLGPALIFISLFRKPDYAYLESGRHYRSQLIFAGTKRAGIDKSAKLIFDSKSYVIAQGLELLILGSLYYVTLVDTHLFT